MESWINDLAQYLAQSRATSQSTYKCNDYYKGDLRLLHHSGFVLQKLPKKCDSLEIKDPFGFIVFYEGLGAFLRCMYWMQSVLRKGNVACSTAEVCISNAYV